MTISPWVALAVTVLAFGWLWRLSVRTSDCGVVDLYWAFGFSVIAAIEFATLDARTGGQALLLALVLLWSARLGWHLVARHVTAEGEDARYAKMRREGGADWPRKSFWWVFMLQAAVMWLVASPIHAAFTVTPVTPHDWLLATGTVLFVVGFVIEAVADAALARFRRDPARRGTLLTTGLFAWSRHPNYFGEALLWWGIGLVALGVSGAVWALAGPLVLTILLVWVSGVPMLDAHLSVRPGFQHYAATTSAFIPLPPQKAAAVPMAGEPGERR